MRTRGWSAALIALLAGALSMGAAAVGAVAPTTATWTDQVAVTAPVSAGTWEAPSPGTCVAYSWDGHQMDGCTVTRIRYEGWGTHGSHTHNYYISFSTPSGAKSVTFDVDLNAADRELEPDWSWEHAGVASGAQFAPMNGWTCEQLPRVQGRGSDWQIGTIYFQVVENRNDASTLCP